jgi:hypothetical protein
MVLLDDLFTIRPSYLFKQFQIALVVWVVDLQQSETNLVGVFLKETRRKPRIFDYFDDLRLLKVCFPQNGHLFLIVKTVDKQRPFQHRFLLVALTGQQGFYLDAPEFLKEGRPLASAHDGSFLTPQSIEQSKLLVLDRQGSHKL